MSDEHSRSLARARGALDRLEEALRVPRTNPLWLDGTIHRFVLAFALMCKALRLELASGGVETANPGETLRRASDAGWLDDEGTWCGLLRGRGLSRRSGEGAVALEVHERARRGLPEMRRLLELLERRARKP